MQKIFKKMDSPIESGNDSTYEKHGLYTDVHKVYQEGVLNDNKKGGSFEPPSDIITCCQTLLKCKRETMNELGNFSIISTDILVKIARCEITCFDEI